MGGDIFSTLDDYYKDKPLKDTPAVPVPNEQVEPVDIFAKLDSLPNKSSLADKIPKPIKVVGKGIIKFLEIIDRPDRSFRTVMRDLVDGDEFKPLESALEGIKGQGKDIGTLIPEKFRGEHPALGLMSDIGLTIATSPTTWLTAGLGSLTKVGKLSKTGQLAQGYKAVRQLDKIAKTGSKASPKILKRLTKLSKFTKGTTPEQIKIGTTIAERTAKGQQALAEFGIPFLKPTIKIRGTKVIETSRGLVDMIKNGKVGQVLTNQFGLRPVNMSDKAWASFKKMKIEETTDKLRGYKGKDAQIDGIAEFISAQGLTPDEVGAVLESLEKASGKALPVHEALQLKLKVIFDNMTSEREALGLPILQDHVPHISKKTKLQKTADYFKVWAKKNPADFHRNIRMLDETTGSVVDLKNGTVWQGGKKIREIDAPALKLMKESEASGEAITSIASIREIEKAYGKKMFTEDVAKILDKSMTAHINQRAGMRFYNKAKQAFGSPTKVNATDVLVDNAWIPAPVATELHRVAKVFDPGEFRQIKKVHDDALKGIKALQTVYNVPFHARNEAWNVIANAIGDVKNPLVYAKAAQIELKVFKKIPLNSAEKQILTMYTKQGLDSVGWFGGDMIFKGKVTQKAMGVGKAFENNAKMAHFIDKINKGFSPDEAARSARKYLFDYADITPFERDYMKKWFPYYTFAKKNLALHAELLVESPQKLLNMERSLQAIERMNAGDVIPTKYLPDYLKQSHPLLIGSDEEGREYLSLGGWLATADIDEYTSAKGIGRTIMNMLTPIAKIPLQLLSGYDFFKEQRYEDMPEQEFLFGTVSPAFKSTISTLYRPLAELDKLIGDKYADKDLTGVIQASVLGIRSRNVSDEELAKNLKFMSAEDRKKTTRLIRKFAFRMAELKIAGDKAEGIFEESRAKIGLGPAAAAKRKKEQIKELILELEQNTIEQGEILKGLDYIGR